MVEFTTEVTLNGIVLNIDLYVDYTWINGQEYIPAEKDGPDDLEVKWLRVMDYSTGRDLTSAISGMPEYALVEAAVGYYQRRIELEPGYKEDVRSLCEKDHKEGEAADAGWREKEAVG